MNQAEKAVIFQALHVRRQTFVVGNPWDAGSARILTSLKYEALSTTSAGLAFSLGRKDGTASVTRAEALANAKSIVDATTLPVAADLENGYGHAPEDAAETIRLAAETGLVGGSIEDATGDPANPIYDFHHAVERVAAAAQAAKSLPFPFMFVARAENFLHGRPDLDDTIRRLQAFEKAGAEVLYAPGLTQPEDIRTVCASLTKPVNVLVGLKNSPPLTVERTWRSGRAARQPWLRLQPRSLNGVSACRTRSSRGRHIHLRRRGALHLGTHSDVRLETLRGTLAARNPGFSFPSESFALYTPSRSVYFP